VSYTTARNMYAPNNTLIETPESIQQRTSLMRADKYFEKFFNDKEYAASMTSGNYAAPIAGTSPSGFGYTFGDSWRRTQRGVMEFQMPTGQEASLVTSLRYAFENVFVGKSLRVKVDFTCKGLSNQSPSDDSNDFFDDLIKRLYLNRIYRQATWLYYAAGMVPILLPEPGEDLSYVEILDPRMVKVQRQFGKTFMYVKPDKKMLDAASDPNGQKDIQHKDYWSSLPRSWKKQLQEFVKAGYKDQMIRLEDQSFVYLENRYNPFSMTGESFDGLPLQPYFSACAQYRQLAAGDFAAGFVNKNLLALVSVGDPKAEGENYIRPDTQTLQNLELALQNPSQAQWVYGDPTMNVRYITPDPNVFDNKKYAQCMEELKNLLPSPFWYNNGTGSFAASQTEMDFLEEEVNACNDTFDREFWIPLFYRATEGKKNYAKKAIRAPKHDRNALKNETDWLQAINTLYGNGGLDIHTLMEQHGFDPDVIKKRLLEQQPDAKNRLYSPAFEGKQGIVADTLGVQKTAGPANAGSGKRRNGRPNKPGSKPQSETPGSRAPRPNT